MQFTGSDEQHMEPANSLLITSTIIIALFSNVGIFDVVLKGYLDFESDPWPLISDRILLGRCFRPPNCS
ncbi:putative non-specific serine/threonine protein kinase [Helianthus anomalus]